MSEVTPHRLIEELVFANSAVKSAKDKLAYCEKQLYAARQIGAPHTTESLALRKSELALRLEDAYEERRRARKNLDDLFARLKG